MRVSVGSVVFSVEGAGEYVSLERAYDDAGHLAAVSLSRVTPNEDLPP